MVESIYHMPRKGVSKNGVKIVYTVMQSAWPDSANPFSCPRAVPLFNLLTQYMIAVPSATGGRLTYGLGHPGQSVLR